MKIKSLLLIVCSFLFFLDPAFTQNREYQIKAEFLERFTRFIDWPPGSPVSNPSTPFSICVIGKNPYGSYLKDLSTAVKVQKKQIELMEISSVGQIQSCNLLFISKSEHAALAGILNYTADKPILTVSDSPGFGERGVLINFYDSGGFVRFEINPQAVQKSHLRFSSRLLKLGRLIDPQTSGREKTDALP